jgi:polysaccharide export outer membrane protein
MAALLGCGLAGSGCQSMVLPFGANGQPAIRPGKPFPPVPPEVAHMHQSEAVRLAAGKSKYIEPQTELSWLIDSPQFPPGRHLAGTSIVRPNGEAQIGPYGMVHVAGLTPANARKAIERHLSTRLRKPRFTLTRQEPAIPKDRAVKVAVSPQPTQKKVVPVAAWQTAEPFAGLGGEVVGTVEWQRSGGPALPANGVVHAVGKPAYPSQSMVTKDSSSDQDEPLHLPRPGTGEMDAGPWSEPGLLQGPPERGGHEDPLPRELRKVTLPAYVIEAPDILLVESNLGLKDQPIRGQHLVRPDGTINLGIYGSVYVAGMTLEQARAVIADLLSQRVKNLTVRNVSVDVLAYNSKVYYVITDGGGYGEQVVRLPITGNETVLDAISLITGLPPVASKKLIWVARATPGHQGERILPVDWIGITQHGSAATNYQLLPGDRLYVQSEKLRRIDAGIAKFLSPIERILGVTLLGSETVNSIAGRGTGTTTGR